MRWIAAVLLAGCARTGQVSGVLVKRLQPFGNIQSRRTRISRPGMRVHCLGEWPFKRHRFHDND